MSTNPTIDPAEHKRQIEAYAAEREHYRAYAKVLERVLRQACAASLPEAVVQTRAKTVSSFAEKCVRKYAKYKDPVHELTDLCGGRVIVQTLEQVEAVKQFVDANLAIHERDEKGTQLGDDRFGYRDMHYIVALRPDRCEALGITPEEQAEIGARKAELQVRTWLQHAWADTLHDRLYKNALPLSAEIRRTGNLLAALMEEGDRNYNAMACDIDGMTANYAAIASRKAVEDEIATQKLILQNEPSKDKKPALALTLARLLAASGDHQGIVELLSPSADLEDANRCERLVALGHALCHLHRGDPRHADYQQGRKLLEDATEICQCSVAPFVPNLRKRESLHARSLARLAWALEVVPGQRAAASKYWRLAHEHEPANPYYLAGMLSFEAIYIQRLDIADTMRVTLIQAVKTCLNHIATGTEMPGAAFTAGRLNLLLGQPREAVGCYARGIRHMLDGTRCVPTDVLSLESEVVGQLLEIKGAPCGFAWVAGLLAVASGLKPRTEAIPTALPPKALMVAGGAMSLDSATVVRYRPLLEAALEPFTGMVISGGTTVGVPGCVGEVTRALRARNACLYRLIGYVPHLLPEDAQRDKTYELRECGTEAFSAEQVLQGWRDVLKEGIPPEQVVCLGIGGGEVSALEYCIALGFGATVAVVPVRSAKEGDAAARLAADPIWAGLPNLFPIPLDPPTVRALVVVPAPNHESDTLEEMARAFHEEYVRNSTSKLPDAMKPWPKLPDTFKVANREQAKYAVQVLESCGFEVHAAADRVHVAIFDYRQFTDAEVECMAQMEHGRWNVERLRNGWRPGARDDAKKLHPCLVPWSDGKVLTEEIKGYDRSAVRQFPTILAKAGLEVRRR